MLPQRCGCSESSIKSSTVLELLTLLGPAQKSIYLCYRRRSQTLNSVDPTPQMGGPDSRTAERNL